MAESAKPKISAHKTAQVIDPLMVSAWPSAWPPSRAAPASTVRCAGSRADQSSIASCASFSLTSAVRTSLGDGLRTQWARWSPSSSKATDSNARSLPTPASARRCSRRPHRPYAATHGPGPRYAAVGEEPPPCHRCNQAQQSPFILAPNTLRGYGSCLTAELRASDVQLTTTVPIMPFWARLGTGHRYG